MRAYEKNPWLRRATLHNIRVRGLPAAALRSSARSSSSAPRAPLSVPPLPPSPPLSSTLLSPLSNRMTSAIHLAPSSHPAASASPSGDRPAAFLTSIRATPVLRGNSTSARAVARCALSAAQWSAVEPALFSVERSGWGRAGGPRGALVAS
jgi:hypothetical protein